MERDPDVEMHFSVRAAEVRLECTPDVDVVAFTDSPAVLDSQSDRKNLPDEVEPGVTYRDVVVRWRTAVWLGDPTWEQALNGERRTRRLSGGVPPQEF